MARPGAWGHPGAQHGYRRRPAKPSPTAWCIPLLFAKIPFPEMAASLSFLCGGREQPGRAPSSPGSSPGQVRRSPPSHCLALPPRKKMRGQRNSLGFLVFPKHSGRGLLCYLLPKSGQRLRAAPGAQAQPGSCPAVRRVSLPGRTPSIS